MKVGFIGYGNMSGAVVRALLTDGSLEEGDVVVFNRTADKLTELTRAFPGVSVVGTMREVAARCDVLVLGVKTGAVREVVADIAPALRTDTHLVTINGGMELANLERVFRGAVSKVIPSVTIETGRGVTLVCHNGGVTPPQRERLGQLFSRSSLVREVREEQLEAATDLTSCAPGLMSEIMLKFAEEGAREGGIPRDQALEMVLETMLGTAILLTDGGVGPEELKSRVATKGGITEQGLRVLDRELPHVYAEVFRATLAKHAEVKRAVTEDFERHA